MTSEDTVTIPLTQGQFAVVDACDRHLGKFCWYAQYNVGNKSFYASRTIGGGIKRLYVRLHHAVVGKPLYGLEVDHINGDTLDNRRKNLRIVSKRENLSNQKRRRDGRTSSQYVGVFFDHVNKNWKAQIRVDDRALHIGRYPTEELASMAYQKKLSSLEVKP